MSAINHEGGPQDPSPNCASPSQMSLTLSQSASSSPPEPSTPRRTSRTRRRYPEDLGRVPLHRRGTSNTYERLEDLLKEAGYKETRIFTPETERSESHGDAKERKTSGMDAVVGFFAGLIPGGANNKSSEHATTEPYSPPHSPLANRHPQRNDTLASRHSSTISSSIEHLPDEPSIAQRTSSLHQPQAQSMRHIPSHLESYASHQIHRQESRSSMNQTINIASPRPSRAGAYLRHMASVSNILPERPNSTPAQLHSRPRTQLNDEGRRTQRGREQGDAENEPPLPSTWLETVARAVLFGGNGAYIGGPSGHKSGTLAPEQQPSAAARVQILRPTRSSLSQVSSRRVKQRQALPRSGLADQTNSTTTPRLTTCPNGFLVPPPHLLSQIERGRAGTTEGTVSMTRVVCRSAPGSRSTSTVRPVASAVYDQDDREKSRNAAGTLNVPGRRREKKHKKKRKTDSERRLPSLARTQVEGDFWSMTTFRRRSADGWGAEAQYYDDSDSDGDYAVHSSSEDDDGELDLARLLVPPKRQQSIHSLRKHLSRDVVSSSPGPSARAALKRAISGDPAAKGDRASFTPPARPNSAAGRVNIVSGRPPNVSHRPLQQQQLSDPSSSTGSGQSATASSKLRSSSSPLRHSHSHGDRDAHGDELDDDWGRGWMKHRSGRGSRLGLGARGSLESDEDDDVQSFKGFFGEGRAVLGERDKRRGLGFGAPWLGGG